MNRYLSKRAKEIQLSPIRRVFDIANRIPNLIRLDLGQPDFKTPKNIREVIKRVLLEEVIGYTPAPGLPATREAVAERLKADYSLNFDPEREVIITNGANGAICLTIRSIINPGDEVLRPDPGYPQYDEIIKDNDGIPVYYPLDPKNGFSIDFDKLEKLITDRTKLIIICSPNNPTGSMLDEIQLKKLLEIVNKKDIMVISDEVYDKIIYEKKHIPLASIEGSEGRVITVGSCSKRYSMTGWRIGYAAGPGEIIKQVAKFQSVWDVCPNYISQKAATEALNSPQNFVEEMKGEYLRRRNYFVQALNEIPGMKCSKPEGTFYIFVDISQYGMDDWEFTKYLMDEVGVTCIHGSAFGPAGKGHVRFSYANSIKNLREAYKRLKNNLKI